jgi:hypothetical protein
MTIDSFGQNFENLNHDIGFQPEVISPELPPRQRFDYYVQLLNAPKQEEVSDAYHARLVEHYRRMAELARVEIEVDKGHEAD